MTTYKTLSMIIVPQTPLHLGDQSGVGNFEQTTIFIPGAAIRGALATKVLQEGQADFEHLFGEDDIFFGNAYPGQSAPVYPFPLTARRCKYYPGIPTTKDKSWEIKHGVYDILIERFLYELLVDTQFTGRDDWLPELKDKLPHLQQALAEECPRCQPPASLTPEDGYYIPDGETIMAAQKPLVRRRAHVGINRARHVAEDGLLFTQEVAEPTTRFLGQISVPADKAEALAKYLDGEHHLGRGRSRGQGRVLIGVDEAFEPKKITARLTDFNAKIQEKWKVWQKQDASIVDLPGTFFAITLRSPAIFEKFGQPRLVISGDEINMPKARLRRAWSRPHQEGGWHVAAKMARRTRLGICAGSVFLFHWETENIPWDQLEKIEQEGIGAERIRGFGQVEICAPFHSYHTLSGGQDG